MGKKQWLLIGLVVLLGGLSLYLNKDWFSREDIHVYHRSRPARAATFGRRRPTSNGINPITFGFDHKVRLTSLKVVAVAALQTNKYAQPIWYLISDSNSVPTKDFLYGTLIPGMRPAVKGARPDPPEPGVPYRLLIEAGTRKATHDFVPTAVLP